MEDVEGEGEVSGDPQHSALPVQVALSVPHGSHDEPVGSNAPKRLSNDVGRVVAVGNSHHPVGSNPGKEGGNAENQGGQSVFLNCLEQLWHRAYDVPRKKEGQEYGEVGPVINEGERSRPSRSEKRFQKARPECGEKYQRHRSKTACNGKHARRFSLSLDGKEQQQSQR